MTNTDINSVVQSPPLTSNLLSIKKEPIFAFLVSVIFRKKEACNFKFMLQWNLLCLDIITNKTFQELTRTKNWKRVCYLHQLICHWVDQGHNLPERRINRKLTGRSVLPNSLIIWYPNCDFPTLVSQLQGLPNSKFPKTKFSF